MSQISHPINLRSKRKYSPNLDDYLSQCELNYLLCYRVWPSLFNNDEIADDSWAVDVPSVSIKMWVTEAARYTTTLTMQIRGPGKILEKGVQLIVRLYHDAKMMEVMEGTGPGALKAIIDNHCGHKPADEKRQVNRFLGECLRASMKGTSAKAE